MLRRKVGQGRNRVGAMRGTQSFAMSELKLGELPLQPGFDVIAEIISSFTDAPLAFVSLPNSDSEKSVFESLFAAPEPNWRALDKDSLRNALCSYVCSIGCALIIEDVGEHDLASEFGVASFLGVPIRGARRDVVGTLCAVDVTPRSWSARDLERLQKFAIVIENQIQIHAALIESERDRALLSAEVAARRANEARLQKISTLDPLTGVFNRRGFEERAAMEAARSNRFRSELCVAIADLDHFKSINDTFGHDVGDAVLKATAETLQETLRTSIDVVARLGGDEFAILLPETGALGALTALERCRVALETLDLGHVGVDRPVTASFGVSLFDGDSLEASLKRADQALYAAKRAGRNRVSHADAPETALESA